MKSRITTCIYLLVVCLMATVTTATALQSGDFTYEVNPDGITVTIAGYTGIGGTVVIPDMVDNKTVTIIGDNAFKYGRNITDINIPVSVINIGYAAFFLCDSLTAITLPDSVTNIGVYAFCSCDSLTDITIPHSVTSIGVNAFIGCDNLTAITVDLTNPAFSSHDGIVFNKDQTTLIIYPGGKSGSYTIPDNVMNIGSNAFHSCTSLSDIMISDSVTNIGVNTFNNCTHLTVITVDLNNPSYSSLDGILFNKDQTKLITCPEGTAGYYLIPVNVTNISRFAFKFCTSLIGVTIPDSVTVIEQGAFHHCYSLDDITIPDSVTILEGHAFSYCTGLTNATVGNGITNIGESAFTGCKSLTNVIIPESITSIGNEAFRFCYSLTHINIPKNVKDTGEYTFASCTNLTFTTIGSSITNIGRAAFLNCSSLKGVYFTGNAPSTSTYSFYDTDLSIIYYLPGTSGWGATLGGRPTVLWNPLIHTSDVNFGAQGGAFGFNISGTSNELVKIETCTNLIEGVWEPETTTNLTVGSVYFSDPDWIDHPNRFYRLSMP